MHGNEFSHVSQTNSGKRRASQTTEGLRWGGGDSEKWGLVTSVSVQVPSSPSKCRGEVSLSSFNHCDTHLYKMQKIQNIHAEESDWKLISCSNFPVNSCYFFSFIIFFFFSQILTPGAVRKANLQWIYRFLHYPSEMQGFSPATWSVPKTVGGVAVLMFTLFLTQSCAWRVSLIPLCKSLHLQKPSRKDFHWDQPSNSAFSATAGFLWSHIPTRAFTWKAASLQYLSEVPWNPRTTPPLIPISYIFPKVGSF